jgi:hypothetical protein
VTVPCPACYGLGYRLEAERPGQPRVKRVQCRRCRGTGEVPQPPITRPPLPVLAQQLERQLKNLREDG